MPKNKGKGGKNRRRGKNDPSAFKRTLQEKIEGEEYGQVLRMLGNGRAEVACFSDGGTKKRICHIRGKMRKKVWVNQNDIVLVGLREYQDEKGDIILRYNAEEARALKKKGELPLSTTIEDRPEGEDDDVPFDFTADGDSDDSDDSGEELMSQPSTRGMLPPSDSDSDGDLDDL